MISCRAVHVPLGRTALCRALQVNTESPWERRQRLQPAASMKKAAEGGPGAAYTGDVADMPMVGVLGGGQLGKMFATAAVRSAAVISYRDTHVCVCFLASLGSVFGLMVPHQHQVPYTCFLALLFVIGFSSPVLHDCHY